MGWDSYSNEVVGTNVRLNRETPAILDDDCKKVNSVAERSITLYTVPEV